MVNKSVDSVDLWPLPVQNDLGLHAHAAHAPATNFSWQLLIDKAKQQCDWSNWVYVTSMYAGPLTTRVCDHGNVKHWETNQCESMWYDFEWGNSSGSVGRPILAIFSKTKMPISSPWARWRVATSFAPRPEVWPAALAKALRAALVKPIGWCIVRGTNWRESYGELWRVGMVKHWWSLWPGKWSIGIAGFDARQGAILAPLRGDLRWSLRAPGHRMATIRRWHEVLPFLLPFLSSPLPLKKTQNTLPYFSGIGFCGYAHGSAAWHHQATELGKPVILIGSCHRSGVATWDTKWRTSAVDDVDPCPHHHWQPSIHSEAGPVSAIPIAVLSVLFVEIGICTMIYISIKSQTFGWGTISGGW